MVTKQLDSESVQDIWSLLANLKTWRRGDTRAPHKPLLILLALGRLSRGLKLMPFIECESTLAELLREFGPPSKALHPEYPFWRLQRDGLWVVSSDRPMNTRISNNDPPRTELRSAHAVGMLSPQVLNQLAGSLREINAVAQSLLDQNFPATLHEDIRSAVGLVEAQTEHETIRRQRDPNFRNAVLQAYEFRCAVCQLDLRFGNLTIGLEAAHIKWHMAHGPDTVENGLSLCALHHKLFDHGAISIDESHRVLVSDQVHGGEGFEEVLMRHHAKPLRPPIRAEHRPERAFTRWHVDQVFKGTARPT